MALVDINDESYALGRQETAYALLATVPDRDGNERSIICRLTCRPAIAPMRPSAASVRAAANTARRWRSCWPAPDTDTTPGRGRLPLPSLEGATLLTALTAAALTLLVLLMVCPAADVFRRGR